MTVATSTHDVVHLRTSFESSHRQHDSYGVLSNPRRTAVGPERQAMSGSGGHLVFGWRRVCWARSTEWRELEDAVARAESVIRREVNLRHLNAAAWNVDDSSFRRTVLSRPVARQGRRATSESGHRATQ